MVLSLKTWKSRSLPGLPRTERPSSRFHDPHGCTSRWRQAQFHFRSRHGQAVTASLFAARRGGVHVCSRGTNRTSVRTAIRFVAVELTALLGVRSGRVGSSTRSRRLPDCPVRPSGQNGSINRQNHQSTAAKEIPAHRSGTKSPGRDRCGRPGQ